MVRGGPAHHTVWPDDSPGDVIEGLRGVIAGGLVKEREALLQDKAAADEAYIAKLRRAAAAAVEAELAAKNDNVHLKAELAQVLPASNRLVPVVLLIENHPRGVDDLSLVQVREAYQALANRRTSAAVEGQKQTRSENEQLRSSYRTLSQKYEELADQLKEHQAAHQAATEQLDAKTSSCTTLSERLDEKTLSCSALTERLDAKSSALTTLSENFDKQTVRFDKQAARLDLDVVVPRLLRFATRRPATSQLEKCWAHWTGLARKGIFYSVRAASIQSKLAWKRCKAVFRGWERLRLAQATQKRCPPSLVHEISPATESDVLVRHSDPRQFSYMTTLAACSTQNVCLFSHVVYATVTCPSHPKSNSAR